jgi:hypothetical protein
MRVHPTLLSSRAKKWQFPVAFGLVIVLLITIGFRKGGNGQVAPQGPQEKSIDVLVASSLIEAGEPLDLKKLALEARPVRTLPKDVVSSFDAVKNKVAAGPIPQGYPLATTLLADPVVVLPVDPSLPEVTKPVDPVDTLLQEIEQTTVAVPVTFISLSPPRGTRVAVALSKDRGDSILVLSESWVSTSNGREATLRLNPTKALLLQYAKSYGDFSFIEIPTEGPSPYEGKAVESEAQLKALISGKPAFQATPVTERKFKGYAWIPGEDKKFGIDSEGAIEMVPRDSSK